MSATISKDAVIKISDAANAVVNLTGGNHVKDIKPTRSGESLDTTALGSGFDKTSIPGLLDSDYTIEAYANATTRALFYGLFNARKITTIEIGPDGSAVGNPKNTGTAFITKIEETTAVGNVKMLNIDMKGTGAVTNGTYV